MTLYEGDFSSPAGRFAVVAARFNATVVDALLGGTLDGLKRHGVAADRVDVVRVSGSFEIPRVAQRLGAAGNYAAGIGRKDAATPPLVRIAIDAGAGDEHMARVLEKLATLQPELAGRL